MASEIKLYNRDCMEAMKEMPDKAFDLAIVDPPYGIGAGGIRFINGTSKTEKKYYRKNDWDTKKPSAEYFLELKRISLNQIVWGGNYFASNLGDFRCFVVWDKTIHGNSYADCELAYTSFDQVARYYRKNISETTSDGRIHPTQKPESLYRYLLKNYAKPSDKIIDTHLGSGSIAIACYDMGFDLTAYEIDKDYFDAAVKRLENHKKQQTMW